MHNFTLSSDTFNKRHFPSQPLKLFFNVQGKDESFGFFAKFITKTDTRTATVTKQRHRV